MPAEIVARRTCLAVVAVAAACSGRTEGLSPPAADGGIALIDGGVQLIDGGSSEPRDGGVVFIDGGVVVVDGGFAFGDGGVMTIDGGVVAIDGGVSPIDGGIAFVDGGVVEIDGGVVAIDGGVVVAADAGPPDAGGAPDSGSAGLLAHWPFDEAAGTVANDTTGLGNNGTLSNMDPNTAWQLGRYAAALELDGADDSIQTAPVDVSGSFTISAWILLPPGAAGSGQPARPIAARTTSSGNPSTFVFSLDFPAGSNQLRFVLGRGDGVAAHLDLRTSGARIPPLYWVHVAASYEAGTPNRGRIYVNGARAAETIITSGARAQVGGVLAIGGRPGVTAFEAFRGRIDDVRVYGRALSAREVSALFVPGPNLIRVAAGTFDMGSLSTEIGRDTDEDRHSVTLTRSVLVQVTEVSDLEYTAVTGDAPPGVSSCSGGSPCPVIGVSWHEAAAYANSLSALNGIPECYNCSGSGSSTVCAPSGDAYGCAGYRLPTESEWERAARYATAQAFSNGGNIALAANATSCGSGLLLDNGARLDSIAVYCGYGRARRGTGTRAPNPGGFYDFHGNVHEWTGDWYTAALGTGPATDPAGAESGTLRVLRGGAFASTPAEIRSASRLGVTPATRTDQIGFRVVRSE